MTSVDFPLHYTYSEPTPGGFHQLATQLMDNTSATLQLSRRYEQLLRSEKHYDCIFHIDGQQFKCHKLILSTASPVFEAMFYGPIREEQQEIEILDCSADIFQLFLSYIYTGSVNFELLTLEQTIELHYCAEKYLISELTANCLLVMARKLRYANILPALELSVCMELRDLLEVCMSFFTRCCLSNPQYMAYHKCHYLHVSKDCIKAIIAANKASKQLLWFVYEWCQQECHELGLQQTDCALIIDDLQLPAASGDNLAAAGELLKQQQCSTVERSYYKACRPFTVDYEAYEWKLFVKCNRFIALHGIIMHSRLMPHAAVLLPATSLAQIYEYHENLRIEITAPNQSANALEAPVPVDRSDNGVEVNNLERVAPARAQEAIEEMRNTVIWQHTVAKQPTRYNCDVNIDWREGVMLSPDVEYQIKLIWQSDAFGSEYPCSLQSNIVDGIQFRDSNAYSGSPIKGLRFVNLV